MVSHFGPPCKLHIIIIELYRVAHKKPARSLVDQRGRRFQTL